MHQGLYYLNEGLRDRGKILKLLTSRAVNLYGDYRRCLDNAEESRLGPSYAVAAICEAADVMLVNVLRDASGNGADGGAGTDKRKERLLREANRFLNFASRVVAGLLKDSARHFEHHKGQNAWRARLEVATAAHEIAGRITSISSSVNPQSSKWHGFKANCESRISDIWREAAQESLKRAKATPPAHTRAG